MTYPETVSPIFNTLHVFDPDKATICVGGAAMAVHLAAAGVEIGQQADVDVMCPGEYFTAVCAKAATRDDLAKFGIRWPYGNGSQRALSPVFDMYPNESLHDTLPFSATEAMGADWFPMYYKSFAEDSPDIVRYDGYRFLSMARLLVWTAVAGREKDFDKLQKLLPISYQKGLISKSELEEITKERDISMALRQEHPERHFARVAR